MASNTTATTTTTTTGEEEPTAVPDIEHPTEGPSSTQAEVEALKSKYGADCKVIQDVGIFTHIVSVQLHGKDLTIKFQIEDTYPKTAPNLRIVSGQMSVMDSQSLHQHLEQEAVALLDTPMLDSMVNLSLAWVEDHELDLSIKVPRDGDRSRRRQKSRPNKNKAKKSDEEEDTDSKKPPMKTAEEVISRILWDDDLPSDCFAVGYMDRFVGIVEESFTALSWEDISSVDYNTLVIPKHRIQYFKYKDVKFWDKKTRMDNMFGSTGSSVTITDVIAQWELEHPYVAPAQNPWSDDDDDDEDDVVIHTGCENPTEELVEDDGLAKEPYWGVKIRPTHFLALRVTEPATCAAMAEAHTACIETDPEYKDCIIPTERLHVTLACLGLDTKEQVKHAVKALHEIKSELQTHDPMDIKVEFEDIGNFFHTTMYVQIKENPKLVEFVEHLRLCMTEAGIHLRDIFDFTPHMTLLKLSKQLARDTRNPYLDPRLYVQLEGRDFGSQVLDNIHLCAMSEDRDQDGFYECPTSIHFN